MHPGASCQVRLVDQWVAFAEVSSQVSTAVLLVASAEAPCQGRSAVLPAGSAGVSCSVAMIFGCKDRSRRPFCPIL